MHGCRECDWDACSACTDHRTAYIKNTHLTFGAPAPAPFGAPDHIVEAASTLALLKRDETSEAGLLGKQAIPTIVSAMYSG